MDEAFLNNAMGIMGQDGGVSIKVSHRDVSPSFGS